MEINLTMDRCKRDKIVFVSTNHDSTCLGLRILSSIAKKEGYETVIVFMPSFSETYSKNEIKQLLHLCNGTLAICISTLAISFKKAVQVAEALKPLGTPLIVGGIHATLNPEECLKNFDFVSLGESDYAFIDLLKCIKQDILPKEVKNVCYKVEDKIIKNDVHELIKDLNRLPFPDYDTSNKFVLYHGRLTPFEEKHFDYGEHNRSNLFFIGLGPTLMHHCTRGCLYNCKYCCNHDLKKVYKNKGVYLRVLSVKNTISTLKYMLKNYPNTQIIWFTDDNFLSRDMGSIKKFSDAYKKNISVPFMCYLTPKNVDEEKVKILISAGLKHVEVGVQTGSDYVNNKFYSRNITSEDVLKTSRILNKYRCVMDPPEYQFINTSFLEKAEDTLQTIRLIQKIPKPFTLRVFNLICFPGSTFEKEYSSLGQRYNFSDTNYLDWFKHLKKKNLDKKYFNIILSLMGGRCLKNKYGFISEKSLKFFLNKKIIWLNDNTSIMNFFLGYLCLAWKYPFWVLPSLRLKRAYFNAMVKRYQRIRKSFRKINYVQNHKGKNESA